DFTQLPGPVRRISAQKSDSRQFCRLLRSRRERPRGRRAAAEKRDELAPFKLIELHSVPAAEPDCRISNWRGSVSGYDRHYTTDQWSEVRSASCVTSVVYMSVRNCRRTIGNIKEGASGSAISRCQPSNKPSA